MIDPQLLAIARGDAPADLLLTGGQVVNVFSRTIERANVAIRLATHYDGSSSGRVAGVGGYHKGTKEVDVRGAYIAPGFIDAHMHVESTMLPPSQFVRLASPHGTTGAVFDPHEIANVLGLDGIRLVMSDTSGLPINAMFALSSCVPCSHLENAGARLDASDLEPLFGDPRVVALAEMMNFPGVVAADPEVLKKIALGLRRHVVDGHAPGLGRQALQAYAAAGITSDHECTTAAEAVEKLNLGMQIFIREGSAARNLDALLPAVSPSNAHRFSFCTDDRHPADLRNQGHIDHIVRRAVALGLPPATAIAMASLHTAQHYRQSGLGAVAPGYQADLIVFQDLTDIRPERVYFRGELVAEGGRYLRLASPGPVTPARTVRLPADLSIDAFAVPASRPGATIRVIGMHADQLVTDALAMPALTSAGRHVADASRDILKLAVIERHRATGHIGVGFAHGFQLQRGAIASTVGHDSHNLAVLGVNDQDMLVAARTLEACGGGQCAVSNGRVLGLLPLPIAGLMSDQPAETVINQQRALLDAARELGYHAGDPFMPLSFLSLPVIPRLKLTDLGLVDVDRFALVPLEV